MLAHEKDHRSVYLPMRYIREGALESAEERKHHRHARVLRRQDRVRR